MPLYKTRAVVLKRRELGEADELITLISPTRGKITAVAKGSRRIKSSLAGRVEPFTYLDLLLATGRTLDVISQIRVLDAHRGLLGNLARLAYGSYILDLVDGFVIDEEHMPGVFSLLLQALKALENGADGELAARWAELRLTGELGLGLRLDHCVKCGNSALSVLAESSGGFCCRGCAGELEGALSIDARTVELLRFLSRARPVALRRLKVDAGSREGMRRVLHRHIQYRWPHRFKSADFIKSLETMELKGIGG
jgi:DNA repair protein RecO (recombination protein O)